MEYLLVVVFAALAFGFTGYVIGYSHGYTKGYDEGRSFFGSFRADDTETINRLRGRIIWLEASIRETISLIRDAELSAAVARERLEKTEQES